MLLLLECRRESYDSQETSGRSWAYIVDPTRNHSVESYVIAPLEAVLEVNTELRCLCSFWIIINGAF